MQPASQLASRVRFFQTEFMELMGPISVMPSLLSLFVVSAQLSQPASKPASQSGQPASQGSQRNRTASFVPHIHCLCAIEPASQCSQRVRQSYLCFRFTVSARSVIAPVALWIRSRLRGTAAEGAFGGRDGERRP